MENKFLSAQLNPHFLFNTLNNLYGLTVAKDDRAPETVLNLSEMMAYTLYNANAEKVPLQRELDFLENYFALEKMRHHADRQISMEVQENTGSMLHIAPLLTFAFVENAFKYGLKNPQNPFVKCEISVEGNRFSFLCENDCENVQNSLNKLGGIGLENTKKRLQLIYPDRHDLQIEKTAGSFKVALQIILDQ